MQYELLGHAARSIVQQNSPLASAEAGLEGGVIVAQAKQAEPLQNEDHLRLTSGRLRASNPSGLIMTQQGHSIFFNGWESLGGVLIVGVLAYVGLIVLLRFSGKRTLSKMNAFDLVVTVALGSTLATTIMSKDVALLEGIATMGLLILLQFTVTWLSIRSDPVRRLVRGEPTLLYHRGEFLGDAMRSQRVTQSEVHQAARTQGVSDISSYAVVLETDGSFSVLPADGVNLADVRSAESVAAARN